MIKIRRRKIFNGAADLTPLIDVVFNLLIFFMLTAVAVPQGISLDLPQAKTATTQKEVEAVVSLGKDGKIFFNRRETTLEELKSALAGLSPKVPIVVEGDRAISYGLFVKVMDAIRESGTRPIVLSADVVGGPESRPQ